MDKISSSNLLSLTIAFAIFISLPFIFNYSVVVLDPHYAYIPTQPSVILKIPTPSSSTIEPGININIGLKKPKKFLSGAEKIIISLGTSRGALSYELNESELINSYKSGIPIIMKIENAEFNIGKDFPDKIKDYCLSEIDTKKSFINGNIFISKFKEGFKKIDFEGHIKFKTSLKIIPRCADLFDFEDAVLIDSGELEISFNSEVIYGWSTKGADKYEL